MATARKERQRRGLLGWFRRRGEAATVETVALSAPGEAPAELGPLQALNRELAERNRELQCLQTLQTALHAETQVEPLLQRVADGVVELVEESQAAILLLTPEGHGLQLARVSGNAERRLVAIEALVARGGRPWRLALRPGSLLEYALRTREPVVVQDFARTLAVHVSDPILRAALPDVVRILAFESALALPLVAYGDAVGLLVVGSRLCLGDADVRRLGTFAEHAALAVERTRRQHEVLKQQAGLEQAYHELADSQADAIEVERLRAVGEVASIVAHDFNNTLTSILGTAQVAQRDVTASPSVAERLGVIVRAAEDAAQLVARFRPLCHDEPLPCVPTDLNQLVREAAAMTESRWRHGALGPGVELEVVLELHATQTVALDAAAMRGVVINLILNAVNALPDGGTIMLCTWDDGERVRLSVRDTGCGMDDEVRQHCFDTFYSTSGSAGRGIGLPSARQVVQRHGGEIVVTSELGRGTEFMISLSAAAPAIVGEVVEPTLLLLPDRSLHVLLVDDQADVRATLREMLMALGHQVTLAANGEEALQLFNPSLHSLVLTDMVMPGLSGHELALRIKQRQPTTPVYMLSGQLSDAMPPTVDAWVQKPVSLPTLDRQLRQLAGG